MDGFVGCVHMQEITINKRLIKGCDVREDRNGWARGKNKERRGGETPHVSLFMREREQPQEWTGKDR